MFPLATKSVDDALLGLASAKAEAEQRPEGCSEEVLEMLGDLDAELEIALHASDGTFVAPGGSSAEEGGSASAAVYASLDPSGSSKNKRSLRGTPGGQMEDAEERALFEEFLESKLEALGLSLGDRLPLIVSILSDDLLAEELGASVETLVCEVISQEPEWELAEEVDEDDRRQTSLEIVRAWKDGLSPVDDHGVLPEAMRGEEDGVDAAKPMRSNKPEIEDVAVVVPMPVSAGGGGKVKVMGGGGGGRKRLSRWTASRRAEAVERPVPRRDGRASSSSAGEGGRPSLCVSASSTVFGIRTCKGLLSVHLQVLRRMRRKGKQGQWKGRGFRDQSRGRGYLERGDSATVMCLLHRGG